MMREKQKRGTIVSQEKDLYMVAMEAEHPSLSSIFQCPGRGKFRGEKKKLYVGDHVLFQVEDEEEKRGLILSVEARRNELLRPPVVNVDQVLIVQSIIEPAINPLFFDKLLCVLEKRNIPILIAFSKSDRLSAAMCREWRTRYEKAGYPVHFISSQSGEGIAVLESALHDRMTVLAGPSGAGKSTLIRTLTGHCDVLIGALSQKTVRGKQTTRNARIYLLEQGGYLVDTAGFTSLDLRDFTKAEELAACFPEMASLHGHCKFRDCTHRKEPGCAVVQAVAEGRIDQKRYENYLALFQEIEKMNRY